MSNDAATTETAQAVADTTQTNAAPSFVGADGAFAEKWYEQLPPEFSPHHSQLGTFKDVAGLAKSYIHMRANGPSYPGTNATEEDVARFRQIAQVPEKPEGYGIAKPESLPEGLEWDDNVVNRVLQVAHKHHVPAAALKAIIAEHTAIEGERAAAYKDASAKAQQDAQNELVNEWRGDFEANSSKARHMAGVLANNAGIPEDSPALAQLANNPAFAKLMMQVTKLTGEDGMRAPAGFGDLRSAQQQADEIMAGKDAVWGAKYLEGDIAAMEHVGKLLQKAAI